MEREENRDEEGSMDAIGPRGYVKEVGPAAPDRPHPPATARWGPPTRLLPAAGSPASGGSTGPARSRPVQGERQQEQIVVPADGGREERRDQCQGVAEISTRGPSLHFDLDRFAKKNVVARTAAYDRKIPA